ncbi:MULTISPECIES: SDR family NAD(P)-dependent oxidoreductase [Rhodococcus]|uniref:SDR family NAD(P)-dependent oxidoreductase n=1 Tax=Rhodococcus TaxID=1827 RepID=UPI0002B7E41F|nr:MULTISPECIES: SDR family NAD(P)-dependent oxidoreductase [Rhodococcus]EME18723.1 short chain oxidoreductase [Rhodococcus qingshengii BKS 20-40]MBY6382407.1 SDR family NAD(P)-dependent oxidoreductase [Rhodococcus erythropolis]OQM77902.1 Rhamnolipids biosynthesis 3-oxoacyl-[acyl-carrier-protein] reductase [Rhodococcus sp. 66b]ORI22771.1 short-chain dehydrogenase [Rhodococcus erythropolis]
MTITLITGGNRGLGHEIARRLVQAGQTVWIGARDAENGRKAADRLGADFVQLDVTDDASVDAAVKTLRARVGRLDILINNAGILGEVTAPEDMAADQIRHVYETNVFGLVRVTHAFLPLLRKATAPSVVNVTSGLGSFTLTHDPERVESQYPLAAYGSSKSAVTMLTTQYARTIPGVRFNAVDPGQTATEFTGHIGQSVEEGAEAAVRIATLGPNTPTGTVTDRTGVLPW